MLYAQLAVLIVFSVLFWKLIQEKGETDLAWFLFIAILMVGCHTAGVN